jgi:hypothetical protein
VSTFGRIGERPSEAVIAVYRLPLRERCPKSGLADAAWRHGTLEQTFPISAGCLSDAPNYCGMTGGW